MSISKRNQKIACKKQLFITDYIIGTECIGEFEKLTFLKVRKNKVKKKEKKIKGKKKSTGKQAAHGQAGEVTAIGVNGYH